MKRAPIVIAATAAGVAAILSYHSRTTTAPLPTTNISASPAGASRQNHPSSTTAPTTTTPTTGTTQSSSPTSTAPSTRTVDGSAVQYGYGVLSVRVTASGKHITDVAVKKLQVADSYSGQLAHQVIPMLRSEVLSAQKARINGISGATYTSEAYAQSVQSALDKLHLQ